MLKFIGRALTGLVLTKDAQKALRRSPAAKKRAADAGDGRAAGIAALHEQMKDVVTPERTELIRQAMEVRRAKQQILADLGDEDRRKLVAVAVKRLLREDKTD